MADVLGIDVETAFRRNSLSVRPAGQEYALLFSPGDFGEARNHFFSSAGRSHCPTYVSYSFRASSVMGSVARGPFSEARK